jgi:hypothetical protein
MSAGTPFPAVDATLLAAEKRAGFGLWMASSLALAGWRN